MKTGLAIIVVLLVALCEAQRAPSQYHIQTDQGPDRFFRFQTDNGQYRKEERHSDGSVTGSYGWVDPDGVLRLFDYVSDAGGYRIERQRLFKVGNSATSGGSGVPADCQATPELCFEIYPLDLNADPTFGGANSGPSGPQRLHVVDGSFQETGSFLVSSLTSNQDLANPVSRQNQATFFESEFQAPAPPPPRKVVIGAAANEVQPEQRSKPFVIGAAAGNSDPQSRTAFTRQDTVVIGEAGSGRSESSRVELHPNLRSLSTPSERSGVVIGLRNEDRRRK